MPPDPRVLAFDTSAAHCAAALLKGRRIIASRYEDMTRGQAERLFPLIEEMLGDEGAAWEELDAIGVGIGPGNFTGVRIAVSAARGLSLSLGIPVIGVTGFEACMELAGWPSGRVGVCLPAPRTATYWHVFIEDKATDGPFISDAAPPFGLTAPALDLVVGPAEDNFSHIAAISIGPTGKLSAPVDRPVELRPRIAEAVALRTAAQFLEGGEMARPAPLYIRSADAAPPREAPPVILP